MTTTAGARLAFLSGFTGVAAQVHLRQIAGFYGVAAAMLVAFSGYPTAPAWVHLYPESRDTVSGGAPLEGRISPEWPDKKRAALIEDLLRKQPLSADDSLLINRALSAFLEAGSPPDSVAGREAIRAFLDSTVTRLRRADLARSAASQQFVSDQLDAIAQQRVDNRRRAIILVTLLMLL